MTSSCGRIERQMGRLRAHTRRAAGRYQSAVTEAPAVPAGIRRFWTARPEWDDGARWSEGGSRLRSNSVAWRPEALWPTSVHRTDAEAAVRIQQRALALRPIWHPRADRVQAHILVCVVASGLWKTLEQWQQRAGLGHSPRTIFAELRRIQSTDVIVPTADGRNLRRRGVVRPDRPQAALLDRLGLTRPQRLRVPSPLTPPANLSWRLVAELIDVLEFSSSQCRS